MKFTEAVIPGGAHICGQSRSIVRVGFEFAALEASEHGIVCVPAQPNKPTTLVPWDKVESAVIEPEKARKSA